MISLQRTTLLAAAALLLLAACRTAEVARDDAAPASAEDQLVRQHVEALGGRDALAAITSLKMTGTVFVPTAGWTLPLVVYQLRPRQVRSEVKVEEMGGMEIVSAYDGETAWTINPMVTRRPQKLDGLQARSVSSQADIDGLLAGASRADKTIAYEGEEEVQGTPMHRLRVTSPDSSVVTLWLDAETYLTRKLESRGVDPMSGGAVDVETFLSDYREVAGVQMPFAIEVVMAGQTAQRITFTDVDVNPGVDPVLFAFPEEGP